MTRTELERKFLLMAELQHRQESDPLHQWRPHQKQRDFIDSVLGTTWYENWALWANRAGKSRAGAYCGAHLARFGLPDSEVKPAIGQSTVVFDRATSGWVISLDNPASRDVIQPQYFDNGFGRAGDRQAAFIPDREIVGDNAERGGGWRDGQVLTLKNGSIIGFKSCESGRKKFQGVALDWAHFDEEPPRDIFQEVTIRIGSGRRLRIFGTCTLLPPRGEVGGVTWVYTEKAKPFLDKKPCPWRIFQASIYDNPHLLKEEIALLEAEYPPGSVERRIRLGGELLPGLSGARAYGAFTAGIHVGDPGPIEPRRPLCWALDFNVEPMVSLVGQRHGRVFKVYEELIIPDGSVMDMGKLFREAYPTHRAEVWVYGDATGNNRDVQTAKSDYTLLLNELRGYPVPVRMKVPAKNPSQPDRINAVNRALVDEYGEVGVLVGPSCEELIADFEGVLRDPRGGIYKTHNKTNAYAARTHTSDAFGYWVAFEQPVTSEPISVPRTEHQVSRRYTGIKRPGYSFTAKE